MNSTTAEGRVISWATAAVLVVVAACLIALSIGLCLFGLAQLRAHWPA